MTPATVGYHDKGIGVSIPIRLFDGTDSRTAYNYALSPWTRDVAQDLDRYQNLFDVISRDTKVFLERRERDGGLVITEGFINIFRRDQARGRKAALFCAILACLLFVWPLSSPASANETDRLLESAESAFKAMKQRDYPAIWKNLSEKSRRTIAGDVHKAMGNEDRARYSLEVIQKDFDNGGPSQKSTGKLSFRISIPMTCWSKARGV